MPEGITPPADGQQGAPDSGEGASAPKPEPTFTQPQVDKIVEDRLRRERAQYEDYETLKAKAAKVDEFEAAQKSDLEKAQAATSQAQAERDAALKAAETTKREAAIQLAAASQGADADLVFAVLRDSETITITDGKVDGVDEAVKKLLEAKPYLKIGAVRQSGGEFSGKESETLKDKIKALELKGDRDSIAEARGLKIRAQIGAQ